MSRGIELLALLLCCAAIPLPTEAAGSEAEPHWRALFNGRNLEGWLPKVNHHRLGRDPAGIFSAHDGLLRVRYDRIARFQDEFAHLFYKTPFSYYRLRLDYRFVGQEIAGAPVWARSNSGVMIAAQAPVSMGRDQPFPISIEVQLRNSDAVQQRTTANICSPGTRFVIDNALAGGGCTHSSSPLMAGSDWVHLEVEVRGADRIIHYINGVKVADYGRPQLDPEDSRGLELLLAAGGSVDDTLIKSGYIALQAEGTPIDFRNIEIMPLDPGARAPAVR